jgi:hypothetical protein
VQTLCSRYVLTTFVGGADYAMILGGNTWGISHVSAERQQVTIQYRYLQDATGALGGKSLEEAIRAAMTSVLGGSKKLSEDWSQRACGIPPSSEDSMLMNIYHDGGNCYFGDLTHFTKGHLHTLLVEQANVPMLSVEQMAPPQGKEHVHSLMYWLSVGNHLLLIQSRSLGTKQLEQYLTWLLKDKTGVIGSSAHVILGFKFDVANVGGGDLDDIREIIVGGTAAAISFEEPRPDTPVIVEGHEQIKTAKTWAERAVDVLRAVLASEADVNKLLSSIPDPNDLEVYVHIGYKTRKRKVSRAPMQEALRHLPDGEITAIGRHARSTGKDVRLHYNANVLRSNSLLDPKDTLRALREAYEYFEANGRLFSDVERKK